MNASAVTLATRASRRNAFFFCADAHCIPMPRASVDVVVSICALEHFDDDRSALREMCRVLKPGGFLLMTVDSLSSPCITPDYRSAHAVRHSVVRYYTPDSLERVLHAEGFSSKVMRELVVSKTAVRLALFSLKLMSSPRLHRLFSLFAIPIGRVCDALAGVRQGGVVLGVAAQRPL